MLLKYILLFLISVIHSTFVLVMKKILVTILAITYLAVSSGIAMTIHYCMGKVASVDLMHSSDKCGNCGMKSNEGCCKDEFKIVKLDDTHQISTNDINIHCPVAIINISKTLFETDIHSSQITSDYNNHSPPVLQDVSLCILNSVFRI